MSWVHLHLMLNHFPVVGMLFGIILLLIALMRKNEEVMKISFGLFVLVALFVLPVYFTGEPAEEAVEYLPGVTESFVERHEDGALISVVAIEIVGLAALLAFLAALHSPAVPQAWALAVLILALVGGGLISWTADLGGQIRHTEIRPAVGAEARSEQYGSGRKYFWTEE